MPVKPESASFPVPSPKGVEEFRRLFREKFGRELTDEEAYDLAHRILLLYRIGVGPNAHADAPDEGPDPAASPTPAPPSQD